MQQNINYEVHKLLEICRKFKLTSENGKKIENISHLCLTKTDLSRRKIEILLGMSSFIFFRNILYLRNAISIRISIIFNSENIVPLIFRIFQSINFQCTLKYRTIVVAGHSVQSILGAGESPGEHSIG